MARRRGTSSRKRLRPPIARSWTHSNWSLVRRRRGGFSCGSREWRGVSKLWRRTPELLELVRIDEPAPPPGAPTRSHGAWVLFSPKAMDGAKAVTAPSAEDARSHLVAAVAYSRRCTALVSMPEHSRAELLREAARALAHATAAARAPRHTVGALRMLHTIVTFCQQEPLERGGRGRPPCDPARFGCLGAAR